MTKPCHIFLPKTLLSRAQAGQNTFLRLLSEVLQEANLTAHWQDDALTTQARFAMPGHRHITYMTAPWHEGGAVIRPNYVGPFWNIEAGPKRWDWPITQQRFDPQTVPQQECERFAHFWRVRLFPETFPKRAGYVFMPLQGRLMDKRSFQSCSPLDMVATAAQHYSNRPVIVSLHPTERYSQAEHEALETLLQRHPNLRLQPADLKLLIDCDLVVTQNSSLAFKGYFLRKSAVLFARIDFQHIAQHAWSQAPHAAFDAAEADTPPFDAYLWWFLQYNAINAGRETAKTKIRNRLADLGWFENGN